MPPKSSNSLAAAGLVATPALSDAEVAELTKTRTANMETRIASVASNGWSASGGELAESKHAMQTLLVSNPSAYMDARAAAIEPLKVNVNNAHASALKDMLAAGYPVREAEAKAAQVSENFEKSV